ncbi:hypothetical protein D6D28_06942 [Aureobasidium pullulans]|uniref:GPI anchored serine-rich protein n=1 Tax=Aureobasidium pullulans TaxID=5580 RepID=A0A4S8SCW1_AURPU|nr:hypothetical protein D6D28_06942 [Aureobasidium pullulans]
MQFTNFLLPLLFAISGVSAQEPDVTSVMTYYTTFTVSRVVETTTCTSTTTPPAASTTEAVSTSQAPIISTSQAPVPTSSPSTSFTTELITQTVQRIAASPVVSSSMVTVYPVASAASASAAMPHASTNGTTVAISSPTIAPYTGAASGFTIQFGAAAVIAAVAGVVQML